MLIKLLKMFTGGLFEALSSAYQAKLTADTNEKKLDAEVDINIIEGNIELLLTEQKRLLTAWIRPAIAAPIVLLIWKLVVYDTMLGLGVTVLSSTVDWLLITVVGLYFVTRPFGTK